jgi:hypothetical protein
MGEFKRRAHRAILVAGVGALVFGILGPGATVARAARQDIAGLELLGALPLPKNSKLGSEQIMTIDAQRRRLFLSYTRPAPDFSVWIVEYDLAPRIPKILRETYLGSVSQMSPQPTLSPNTVTLDSKRNRLLILSQDGAPVCPDDPDPFCGADSPARAPAPVKLFVFDLDKFRIQRVVNVQLVIPGFTARGMTYSPSDDRLYMVGEFQPVGGPSLAELGVGLVPRSAPSELVALDAGDLTFAWLRVLPDCQVSMSTFRMGISVVRSAIRPALYFACVRTGASIGPSGIFRVWIDPAGTAAEAPTFATEFFSVPGSYTAGDGVVGIGSFDYATDRFFMQSRSLTTPGAWVFDGTLNAWAGFVAAPDASNQFAGVNQRTGRYYMGSDGKDGLNYLLSTDGRGNPVPQGRISQTAEVLWAPIYVDGRTSRVFVQLGKDVVAGLRWMVYRDITQAAPRTEQVDFDSLTSDLPEGPETISTFAGSVNGFGSRVSLVGGTGGLVSTELCDNFSGVSGGNACDEARAALKTAFNLSPSSGARSLSAAWVPSVDVRNVVASSLAQALALDHVSDGEYETVVKSIGDRARAQGQDELAENIERSLVWPYAQVACLDSGQEQKPSNATGQGGASAADCSYSKQRATASATFGAIALEGVSVAHSSFSSESLRDPKLGIVTKTKAEAKGVELSGPAGSVSIDRIVATAETQAFGRPKTTDAGWERIFEGVSVKDASGKVIFECAARKECDQTALIAPMNDVLKGRMQIELPQPELRKTPGGALASVQENEADFVNGLVINDDENRAVPALQVTVFNDTSEKSRIIVQLAAIQASSIYGISPLSSEEGLPPGGEPFAPPPLLGVPLPPQVLGEPPMLPPAGPGSVGYFARKGVFLIRSPKDALLVGLTLLLLVGAVVSAWRRRILVRQIATDL